MVFSFHFPLCAKSPQESGCAPRSSAAVVLRGQVLRTAAARFQASRELCRSEQRVKQLSPLPLAMLAGRYAAAAAAALTLLLLLLRPAIAAEAPNCDSTTTYTANSTFEANLDRLAAALPANASASPAGFATATVGVAPEQANGLALCRGDTNASACAACVAAAFREAKRACPLDRGASILMDACNLQFASRQFLDFLRPDQWTLQELVYVCGELISASISFLLPDC